MTTHSLEQHTTRRRLAILIILAGFILIFAVGIPAPVRAQAASLAGTVHASGQPLSGAQVTLYHGSGSAAEMLGQATTRADGTFSIDYSTPPSGVLYAEARGVGPDGARVRLLSVVGFGEGGAVFPRIYVTTVINELTTVAATFALAQFIQGNDIWGPSPGLENAAATSLNLADPGTGEAGGVITDANNGANNDSYAILNTVANLVALCSADPSGASCGEFLTLATAPGGTTPTDTVQAVLNLVKNPTLATEPLFTLAQASTTYSPALAAAPQAWLIALLFTDTDLFASGRIAIDARGNVWSNNNWQPGTRDSSNNINVLNPLGVPILGSPITGGGIDGGGWGTAIDMEGNVWLSNYGGGTISKFTADGKPLSPDTGWTNGEPNHPQGVAVDQKGNIWIANSEGPKSAPSAGNVIVYPGGDPTQAIVITGGGINHPFAVQIDNNGNAWVTNGGDNPDSMLDPDNPKLGGSVSVIGPDFQPLPFSPIQGGDIERVLGLALDSQGNAWVASFDNSAVVQIAPDGTIASSHKVPDVLGVWSVTVDGSDRVWVMGFSVPGVLLLCGADTSACPPGSATGDLLSPGNFGFQSKALQHLTSGQIDQAGNLWLSNNWATLKPPSGGVGIVEFVGLATPVCAPLLALPVRPTSDAPCAAAGTAVTPAESAPAATAVVPSTGSPAQNNALAQLALAVLIGVVLCAAGVVLLRPVRKRI